jgi:response regulator RpfG family c-di-GMP phosphodiesterase
MSALMTSLQRSTASVLLLEDEMPLRHLISRWLRHAGYEVIAAAASEETWRALDEAAVAVAVCDVEMRGSGLGVVERLRERFPETAVILATDLQDMDSTVESLRLGVADSLIKPVCRDRLRDAVGRGLEWHRAAVLARDIRDQLRADIELRRAHLAMALNARAIDSRAGLEATLRVLTVHDPAWLDHARRVTELARALGLLANLADDRLDTLERAALVHDVPKLMFPDSLAQKPGALLPLERELIRVAPHSGYDLLAGTEYLRIAAAIVRARFEWWDGSGYPLGLTRDAIPIESRILAVADTFDTLKQPRPYRPAMDEVAAVAEILRCRGTQFDPAVVDSFLTLHSRPSGRLANI